MRFPTKIGMWLLSIYLIVVGIIILVPGLAIPPVVIGVLALVSGIFLIIGR